jgi:ribulose-5-phosphate 4-epimerase/fuculose-1-phosphate aldolase
MQVKTTVPVLQPREEAPLAVRMAAQGEFALSSIPSLKGRVPEAEWKARVDLAASYRLVAHHGWDDMLSTHISARVPGEPERFLINPYGVLFSQVTASSLIKIDASGECYNDSPFPLNRAAVNFHGGVMQARPDVHSALHLHSVAGTAVSMLEDGLLPLNQRALYLIPLLAYYDYNGLGTDEEEGPALARALGDKWFLIMRNHGTLSVGRSIGQAFVFAFYLERACEYQLRALACGVPLRKLAPEIVDKVPLQGTHFPRTGLLEWPALLELADRLDPSFRA